MIESMDDEDRRLSSGSSDNEEAAADEDVKISTDLVGCDLCPFKTSSQSSLQAHAAVHKLREKRSRCSICQFEALTPGRLRHHILDMHAAMSDDPTTGDILFKCLASDCGFSVSCRHKTECRAWSYKHYRQAHLVKVENGYTCVEPGCDFYSRRGAHFRQHLLSHNRESSYECPSCSKQFRSSSHLAEHRKAVHEKARDVECEKCEKKFASRWSLTVHMRSHARDGEYRYI
jgi:KRAB domain-containing zinc finger protein